MTGRRLARVVHVRNARTGDTVTLRPGDDVPGWAADRITNPACWGEDRAALPTAQSSPRPPAEEPGKVSPQATVEPGPEPGPPPQSGRGSSAARWREYAAAHGVTVDPDTDRDDVIALLAERGVPVE